MDIKTLRSKTKEALTHELEESLAQLQVLQFKNSAGQLKQVRQIRELKTMIARYKTLLKES